MKKDEKTRGKRAIVHDVMAKGIPARKASKMLDAVIDAWKYALWCGEEVEVPGGTLQAKITTGNEQASLQEMQNIHTKEFMVRTVHLPGRRRVVKLRPDPKLIVILPPPPLTPAPLPPKPAETSEQIEERRLATELLGLPTLADDGTMTTLRQAVSAHPRFPGKRLPYTPGALLRRLRQFKGRGWPFADVTDLARQIVEYYWV